MIQHDMMLFDHGSRGPGAKVSGEQRAEADVNIEFQAGVEDERGVAGLAWQLYQPPTSGTRTDYPAVVGPHMTNTDTRPFQDHVASVSLRELERGTQIGSGWDPHWHQPTDLYTNFTDKDFRLGLNAAQTTLGRWRGWRVRGCAKG